MESFYFRRAFTLIELLVVLAIIGVIMAVVFTNQSSFNKTLILTDTAYDIALSLRDAETFGLGSRAANATANAGYGIDFQNASPRVFTFFADTYPSPSASNCHGLPTGGASSPSAQPGDCVYEQGQDQKITNYTLGNGITVNNFCAFTSIGGSCKVASGSYSGGLTSLDVVFARPNPVPFISASGSFNSSNPYTAACIALTSPQGGAKFVSVASSGEITANAASCP